MRHQKKRFKLGRTAAHRRATLAAMAGALIEHKRIETTLVKAKALRTFIEPIITRAKDDTTHNRREAFRHLRSKEATKELFDVVGPRVGDRPGGYTRVLRLGLRHGDAAELAVIELVDWNDVQPDGSTSTKKKTRRSRRGSSSKTEAPKKSTATKTAPADEEAVVEEEVVEVEDSVDVEETVAEAEPAVEEVAETDTEVESAPDADDQPTAEAETEEGDSEEKEG